ncbi:MAG: acyltransferase [Acetobacteraceae bacterium]|nr:acyltransferase [Acetobacteraceae bacterium]
MPSPSEVAPRHAGLTRLRFVFIGWVVLYHLDILLRATEFLPWLSPVLGAGYLGVDGFFLLSGFALWLGYGAKPPVGWEGAKRFLLRRVAKIWPLHALALLVLAALVGTAAALGAEIREPDRFDLRNFLLQLGLVHAWETTSRHAWNSPSWALSVEWAGYLAFPLAIHALRKAPRGAVPAVLLLASAGLCALGSHAPEVGLNYTLHLGLVRFGLEFCMGLALGRLATEHRLPPALALAGTAALPARLALDSDPMAVMGLAAVIAAVWQRGGTQPEAARLDLPLRLGEASFGIYMSWVFTEAALVGALRLTEPGEAGRVLLMAAGFLATLLSGWLAWRFVEAPAHRWLLHRAAPAPRRLKPVPAPLG